MGGYSPRGLGTPPFLEDVRTPGLFIFGTKTDDRERIGGNATFQFRPDPSLTFTLDGLYSQFKSNEVYRNSFAVRLFAHRAPPHSLLR